MEKTLSRDEVALQVFLRKIPATHINASTLKGFQDAAVQAYEVADVFFALMRANQPPKKGAKAKPAPMPPEDEL